MILSILSKKIVTIHAAALILGAAGLLSRLLGLLRDRLLAYNFGAARELDVYYAAFQIPDFIYTALLLGAGSMAVLPVFTRAVSQSKEEGERCISELLRFFMLAAGIILGLAAIFAPKIMARLFTGFTASEIAEAVFLTRLMFVCPIFLGLSAIFMSVTQAYQRFVAYSLSGILYNIGIIFGILMFAPFWGVAGLGLGVITGAFLHFLVQALLYKSLGFALVWRGGIWSPRIKEVLFISVPRVAAHSLRQVALALLLGVASTLSAGSIAIFQFANNLAFLPAGIFAISYATAIFPRLASAVAGDDGEKFWRNMFFGMRNILFWVFPASLLIIVLRAHIVRIILGAGKFDWSDTRLTAAAVAMLAVALIAESVNSLFLRAFYALKMTWLPFFANAAAMLFGIFTAIFCTGLLRNSPYFAEKVYAIFRISDVPGGEILGVIFGFGVISIADLILQSALLFLFVRRKFLPLPDAVAKADFFRPLGKIIFASLIGALISYQTVQLFDFFALETFMAVLAQAFLAGMAGILAWWIVLYSMQSEDLETIMRSLHKKFFTLKSLPEKWNGDKSGLE